MSLVGPEPCPLPEHPGLAEVARALNDAGAWGLVLDREWRLVYMTDDMRLSHGALRELVPLPVGDHYFGPAAIEVMLAWSGGVFSLKSYGAMLRAVGPWMVADEPGGAEGLRELVDPRLGDDLENLTPADDPAALTFVMPDAHSAGAPMDVVLTAIRLRDARGALIGTTITAKPAAGMAILGTLSGLDPRHSKRVQQLAKARRHPAAILFADIEASSLLARRLSAASYFGLARRLVRAADRCVIDENGMVGRHVGDGVVAYFLAEHAGSESAAARSCIAAMRALRKATVEVAARSALGPEDVVMRFGLHWGSTLYVGQMTTAARAEVNALGDEMNETARIEACAAGGRALASKALVERLEPQDAIALDLDLARIGYTALADLTTATDKARRDAPAIAVCEI